MPVGPLNTFVPFTKILSADVNSNFEDVSHRTASLYLAGITPAAPLPLWAAMCQAAVLDASLAGCFAVADTGATSNQHFPIQLDINGTITNPGTVSFASGGSGGRQTATITPAGTTTVSVPAGARFGVLINAVDASLSNMTFGLAVITL